MLQKGFTLIELMIVVAIIGILSMFALPAYQDYTKRTYVSEGMALSTGAKLAATEYFSTQGSWPSDNAKAGIAAASQITGQAVKSITIVGSGQYAASGSNTGYAASGGSNIANIKITYNSKVYSSDVSVTIAPTNSAAAGSVEWRCVAVDTNLQTKWLPVNCRNTIS